MLLKLFSLPNPGSCQHLLLATMFALNFCYQAGDLLLVIKYDILEILSTLTKNSCTLVNQGWFAASTPGSMQQGGAVKLACTRLLQIMTLAARWDWRDCKQLQKSVQKIPIFIFTSVDYLFWIYLTHYSSCEDLLPLDVSHALMEVMCEQLQNTLHAFHQLQKAERCTAERPDLDTSSRNSKINGKCLSSHIGKSVI